MGIFNLFWFVFIGWWSALMYLFFALIMALTIIGFPLAKSLVQFANLSAFPFGKEVIRETELKGSDNVNKARKIGGVIVNIVWLPLGVILSIMHMITGLFAFITIIGIPVGVVMMRMAKFIIFPIGAKVVTKKQAYASAVANELEDRKKK